MSDVINVQHNAEQHCFEALVENYRAHLDYRIQDGIIDLHHTFVPDELRGKGVAQVLTKAALSYADQQQLQIRPSCSYVAAYMQRKGLQHE